MHLLMQAKSEWYSWLLTFQQKIYFMSTSLYKFNVFDKKSQNNKYFGIDKFSTRHFSFSNTIVVLDKV